VGFELGLQEKFKRPWTDAGGGFKVFGNNLCHMGSCGGSPVVKKEERGECQLIYTWWGVCKK